MPRRVIEGEAGTPRRRAGSGTSRCGRVPWLPMDLFLDRTRPEAVSELRRQVGGFLERHGTDAEAARTGELVVGELLANAFEHSDGDVWVSVDWPGERPVVAVHDFGPAFAIRSRLPAGAAEGGRGLYLVASLAGELRQAAKAAGGKMVSARLDVRRRRETSLDPPRRTVNALPELDEALPSGGFGKQAFLRALVVKLAQTIEEQQGPDVAEAAVAQVCADVGGQMEEEYRRRERDRRASHAAADRRLLRAAQESDRRGLLRRRG